MPDFLWPSEDGWPYPDPEAEDATEVADPDFEVDDDLLSLRLPPPHLMDDLDATERAVLSARFGIGGAPVRTMKELRLEMGIPRAELRDALESALAKLRSHLV
jgi:DNA-directed RNA polymerase sigma subunit (sigma70/sigma32)